MKKLYSRRDTATAPKELRHLAKLSNLRLVEIFKKRGLREALAIERKHGESIFADIERSTQDPHSTLARMTKRARELGFRSTKAYLLDCIRSSTGGKFLPGLRYVTTAELPKSMRALQKIESDEKLAQIIAERINQDRNLVSV